MRLTFLLIVVCFQVLAQKSASDTLKTNNRLITNRFVIPEDTVVYRIKVNDRLQIKSLNALEIIYPQGGNLAVNGSNMTNGQTGGMGNIAPVYSAMVDRRGFIILPQAGRLKVTGLSRAEAATEIEKKYQDLITNPVFEVEITNLRIRVLGAVLKQGVITLNEDKLTLGEVIALSGGIDFSTAANTIKLIRTRYGIQQEVVYDIRNLSDPSVSNIPVYDDDYVFIPPSSSSIRVIKNQKISSVLQPIALTLNAFAIIIGLYLTISRN